MITSGSRRIKKIEDLWERVSLAFGWWGFLVSYNVAVGRPHVRKVRYIYRI